MSFFSDRLPHGRSGRGINRHPSGSPHFLVSYLLQTNIIKSSWPQRTSDRQLDGAQCDRSLTNSGRIDVSSEWESWASLRTSPSSQFDKHEHRYLYQSDRSLLSPRTHTPLHIRTHTLPFFYANLPGGLLYPFYLYAFENQGRPFERIGAAGFVSQLEGYAVTRIGRRNAQEDGGDETVSLSPIREWMASARKLIRNDRG